jgi:hypothetical protein
MFDKVEYYFLFFARKALVNSMDRYCTRDNTSDGVLYSSVFPGL